MFRPFDLSTAKRLLIFVAGLALCGTTRGVTTDYIYGIQFGQGAGGASDTWNLDEFVISVNGSGTATSYTETTLTNLTTVIPGWDLAGTTHRNQCLNGLALDPAIAATFPVIFADLSDGTPTSILLPKPGNIAAGIVGIVIAIAETVRRTKRQRRRSLTAPTVLAGSLAGKFDPAIGGIQRDHKIAECGVA